MKKTVSLKAYDKNPKKKQKMVNLDNEQTKQKTLLDLWGVNGEGKKFSKKRKSDETRIQERGVKNQKSVPNTKEEQSFSKADYAPWWKCSTTERSKHIWLCKDNEAENKNSESSNDFLKGFDKKSWFTTKLSTRSSSSETSSSTTENPLWSEIANKSETSKKKTKVKIASFKRKRGNADTNTVAVETEEKDDTMLKTQVKRIVRPSKKLQKILNTWLWAHRWTYNQCVAMMYTEDDTKLNNVLKDLRYKSEFGHAITSGLKNKANKVLRHRFVVKKALAIHANKPGMEKLREVPEAVRASAVTEFIKAHETLSIRNKNAIESKTTGKSRLSSTFNFKSIRKDHQQSFPVNRRDWNKAVVSIRKTEKDTPSDQNVKISNGKFNILVFELLKCATKHHQLPDVVDNEVSLTRSRLGKWKVGIPIKGTTGDREENSNEDKSKYRNDHHKVAAIDPGVRTFLTIYDADGRVIEWGKNDIYKKIYRQCERCDFLTSKIALFENEKILRHRSRRRMKRALLRMYARVRNLIDELHRKAAKWLCETYRVILLPKFDTQQMVTRSCRRSNGKRRRVRVIGSKTARAMCTLSHYRFRSWLEHKVRFYSDCRLVICGENHTTKACGVCGRLNHNLKGSKTFKCVDPKCNFKTDRDFNGARNVLLRYLSLNASEL